MAFIASMLKMLPDAAAQGLIWGILAEGADPATTPIGFMSADDMELVINEENADAIGLVIPEDLK